MLQNLSTGRMVVERSLVEIVQVICFVFVVLYACVRIRALSTISKIIRNGGATLVNSYYIKSSGGRYDIIDDQCGVKDLLRVTQHAGRKPYSSILDWGVYFPFLAQCVRLKKFEYLQVSDAVLQSVRLKSAIKQSAENTLRERAELEDGTGDGLHSTGQNEDFQKVYEKEEKRAVQILMGMRSKLSDFLLRVTSWLLYKLLPRFLSGVVTNTKQIDMLKATAEKSDGVPLIFLPLHRSHLDYIIVSFILLNNDIRSPIVVAGDNLQIPIFGFLLRGLGAFFIKRKIDPVVGKKDILYRAVLQTYTQHILEAGHNLEFFVEGGRTRTGKPCMPKSGILSVIVNAFMDGTIKDALLVPVSVNYERLVDGHFVTEQMGQRKKAETLSSAISGIWKALNSKYGLMRIDFNQPFSIKELVQTYNEIAAVEGTKIYTPASRAMHHIQSSSSLYGTDVVNEDQRTLVESIARQVVYDCVSATSVMTTNAIAFLLLTRFRNGATEERLAKELDALRKRLCGRKDLAFSGESIQIVRYASNLLGKDLVSRTKEGDAIVIKPNVQLPHVIELTYYGNGLAPYFVLQSIVVTALHIFSQKEDKRITRKRLKEHCINHCDILRYEFILSKPTQNLDQLLDEAIDVLREEDIVILPENKSYNEMEMHSRRIASYVENTMWDDDDDANVYNEMTEEVIRLASDKKEEIDAYIAILAPYGFTYLVVVNLLVELIGNSTLESDFIKTCIKELTRQIECGECPYSESVSMDSIKNCLKLLEKWEVLEVSSTHGLRLLALEPAYESLSGIEGLIEKFESYVCRAESEC